MRPSLISATGLSSASLTLMKLLKNAPEVGSRNGKTKELTQVCISASDPRDRLMYFESRKEDLIAQIAETLWIVGGSREIKYLTPFLKRAPDYSDDGINWLAGYGYRIRSFQDELDQLSKVIEILKEDKESRRAFLTITDPTKDLYKSKDVACNQMINFLIRPDENGIDRLNMTVNNRSNDFLWGYTGINYSEFTFLQEFIANQLNVELGYYLHNSMSFHVYEPHWEKLENVLEEAESSWYNQEKDYIYPPKVHFRSLSDFDELFKHYKNAIDFLLLGMNSYEVWTGFKEILNREQLESTIYFEIPILYLCLKDPEFAKDELIQSYIQNKYYSESSLFYKKVSNKFQKRIERHSNGKEKRS